MEAKTPLVNALDARLKKSGLVFSSRYAEMRELAWKLETALNSVKTALEVRKADCRLVALEIIAKALT